jgi:hypothetical protein
LRNKKGLPEKTQLKKRIVIRKKDGGKSDTRKRDTFLESESWKNNH